MTKKTFLTIFVFIILVLFIFFSFVTGFTIKDIRLFFTGGVVSNTCSPNSFTTIEVGDSNTVSLGNSAYAIKNLNSDTVALFKNDGGLYLKSLCNPSLNCIPNAGSFVIKNNLGDVVSYINTSGDLCIENADCTDQSGNCDLTGPGFLLKEVTGKNIAYLDSTGDLCLTGNLYQGISFAKQYLLKWLEQVTHNNKVVRIESIGTDKSIVVSVNGVSSNSIALGSSTPVDNLDIKNIDTMCIRCGDGICSSQFGENSNNCPEDCRLFRPPGLCGNGVKDGNEECDTNDFGGGSCSTRGFSSGNLVCTNTCTIDASGCSGSGGGVDGGDSGNGGGSSETKRYSKITAGILTDYYPITNSEVTRISFKLKETQKDVTIKVRKTSPSSSIPTPDGIVYQYFEINFNLDNDKFASSKVEFEVDNSWISRNSFTSDNIRLIKYDGAWVDLITTKVSQTSTKSVYETSDAKGFSVFAIVGRTTSTQPINKCGNGVMNAGEDCRSCPADVRCKSDEYCNIGVCTKKPAEPANICGNNIIDAGEDCRSCPADVKCGSDEYCNNGICAKVQPPVKKFDIKDYIIVLITGILIVIGLIIAIIIYLRANKKTGEYTLKTTGNKKVEELKRLVEDLRAQGYSKDQIRISALRANWPKDMIDGVLKNIK